MARFEVELSATAERQLCGLERKDQVRVVRAIRRLGDEPRPPGARKLRGYEGVYRIRVGVFRVLYSIEADRLVVIVLKIGHRRDAYR